MLFRTFHIANLRKYQLLSEYLNMDDTIIVRNTQVLLRMGDAMRRRHAVSPRSCVVRAIDETSSGLPSSSTARARAPARSSARGPRA